MTFWNKAVPAKKTYIMRNSLYFNRILSKDI